MIFIYVFIVLFLCILFLYILIIHCILIVIIPFFVLVVFIDSRRRSRPEQKKIISYLLNNIFYPNCLEVAA